MFSQEKFDLDCSQMNEDVKKLICTTIATTHHYIPPNDIEWQDFYEDLTQHGDVGYGTHFATAVMQNDKTPNKIVFAITPKTDIAAHTLTTIRLVLGDECTI